MVTFQGFLSKLHPSFDDCPSPCARTVDDERPKDLPDYCAQCEVRRQLDYFERGARRELERRFSEGECPKSFEGLTGDVLRLMALAGKYKRGRLPPGADALMARALDIVRAESRRPERVSAWERAQRTGEK